MSSHKKKNGKNKIIDQVLHLKNSKFGLLPNYAQSCIPSNNFSTHCWIIKLNNMCLKLVNVVKKDNHHHKMSLLKYYNHSIVMKNEKVKL